MLTPEKVAYWYFRLNGFLQIENFVVHPANRGGQRTDADLLAVRFPHRAEFILDHPERPMLDDNGALGLSRHLIDVVIAEVKTNQPCTLNGPWTIEDHQNVNRVVAAIGCLPREEVDTAATNIYRSGHHVANSLRIRLIAVGRDRNDQLAEKYPDVVQLTWIEILTFVWHRFDAYKNQKAQVDQWEVQGRRLKTLADRYRDVEPFVDEAYRQMGVRRV